MQLPIFKALTKPRSVSGIFNGISNEGMFDAVNLVCSDRCSTRNSRKAVMLYSTPPDQIIPCDGRLFSRFGNTIKEIVKSQDGTLVETGIEYTLKNYETNTDRRLIQWEQNLYVLPDNIQIGTDTWLPFAENYALSVSLPFVNSRTLFYTNGYSGQEPCNDAANLKPGMKLRFSWITSKDFTIKTVETLGFFTEDDSFIEEGVRITLDSDVSSYNSIPSTAKIKYCNPQNRPILEDLEFGYNHRVSFSGGWINFYCYDGNYTLDINNFLKIGQIVKISGSSVSRNNATAKILNITDHGILLDYDFTTVTENTKTVITISPIIPRFDDFLITEDRLFGVDNSTGTFHISALKKLFLFYDNPALPEDSWEVKINGTATSLTLWKDNVICFTENGGFRILGYTALNFGVRQLSINGIKKGCERSLVRVGDTLYYCSKKGIMKYSGGSDKRISNSVIEFSNVKSAITDGTFVYMLGNDRIWVYDTGYETWWSENAENILDIFTLNSERYLFTNHAIYLADGDDATTIDWSFELHLLPNDSCKKVQPLFCTINYSENTDCVFTLYARAYGETEWKNCGIYPIKNEGVIKIPLFKSQCSGFRIKAHGYGKFSPENWTVYYRNIG